MPPTAVLREPSPASLVGWAKPRPRSGRGFVDLGGRPHLAALTAAQLAERAYPYLTYFYEVDKGGHLAAWKERELFSEELRAAFWSLR